MCACNIRRVRGGGGQEGAYSAIILKGKQVLLSSCFCYSRRTLIIVDVPIDMQFKVDYVVQLIGFYSVRSLRQMSYFICFRPELIYLSFLCREIAPLFFLCNKWDNSLKVPVVVTPE